MKLIGISFLLLVFTFPVQAQLGGWDPAAIEKAEETREAFLDKDPGMADFFEEAYGYAIFPSIGKGAVGIGGAHGSGTVFEQGKPIGSAKVTQLTVGLQFGGQAYSEVIFFETEDDLDRFRESKFELAAQASAVAVDQGASTNVAYEDGVAVFTLAKGGLMYEASIGGQKFKFKPFKVREY